MTRKDPTTPDAKPGQMRRFGARVLDSERHDPYQPKGKLREMRCSSCGALYKAGRWQWPSARSDDTAVTSGTLSAGTCPACQRVAEKNPAGRLSLTGPYAADHQAELVSLARHEAEAERAAHPMHRIMGLEVSADGVDITTTDIHLPRRIGDAIRRAHRGDLTIDFSDDAYEIRVRWRR